MKEIKLLLIMNKLTKLKNNKLILIKIKVFFYNFLCLKKKNIYIFLLSNKKYK